MSHVKIKVMFLSLWLVAQLCAGEHKQPKKQGLVVVKLSAPVIEFYRHERTGEYDSRLISRGLLMIDSTDTKKDVIAKITQRFSIYTSIKLGTKTNSRSYYKDLLSTAVIGGDLIEAKEVKVYLPKPPRK